MEYTVDYIFMPSQNGKNDPGRNDGTRKGNTLARIVKVIVTSMDIINETAPE
jgi:hypothetical protein